MENQCFNLSGTMLFMPNWLAWIIGFSIIFRLVSVCMSYWIGRREIAKRLKTEWAKLNDEGA